MYIAFWLGTIVALQILTICILGCLLGKISDVDKNERVNEALKKPADERTSAGFKNAYKHELNEENNG